MASILSDAQSYPQTQKGQVKLKNFLLIGMFALDVCIVCYKIYAWSKRQTPQKPCKKPSSTSQTTPIVTVSWPESAGPMDRLNARFAVAPASDTSAPAASGNAAKTI